MKNIFYSFLLTIGFGLVANSQILSNSLPAPAINQSNAFLDASTNYGNINSGDNNKHKGLIFPDVNLTTFVFESTIADGATIPGYYDGMVVYNTGTGNTGNSPASQGVQVSVIPGFYYFSNPDGANNGNVTNGRWIPVGGQSATVKSKAVPVTVAANPTTATLNLGTSIITANEVVSFLGAKVYDSAGNLVMTADSSYDKATNLLTTGNGIMYQVLPAGNYVVVVDYK